MSRHYVRAVRHEEAAHAVVETVLGGHVTAIHVDRTGGGTRGGHAALAPLPDGPLRVEDLEAGIVVALAGHAGRTYLATRGGGYLFGPPRSWNEHDDEDAMRLSIAVARRTGRSAFMIREKARARALQLVKENAGAILSLAAALEAAGDHLEGPELDEAIATALGRPVPTVSYVRKPTEPASGGKSTSSWPTFPGTPIGFAALAMYLGR